MVKVVIFGATGNTGLCALRAAVDKGMTVRAFVRDPLKVPDEFKSTVEVYQGNSLKYEDVLGAMKDVSCVCVVLGTRNDLEPTTDLSESMKNIIKAMKETNVHVVSVCLSAFLFYEPEKVPKMFVDLNADHQRQFDCLKSSGLKYIAVLPPHISDDPKGEYDIAYERSPGRVVSKHDLGQFLIDALEQPQLFSKICGIHSKK